MQSIGKFMQVFALVLLPFAMLMQLTGALGRKFGLDSMLLMMLFGIAAFCLGRVVEGYDRS
ncbi:MAG: hypothetical protein FJ295_00990 [Planctomycetes bacterium]|nr:hypothetical protein [Planctomycetota bacterium]